MSKEVSDIDEEHAVLKLQLKLLAENINDIVYGQRKNWFGAVATIIEATIADPEQRKAFKDLVSNATFGPSYWNDIRWHIEQLASAHEITIWGTKEDALATMAEPSVNPYTQIRAM